MTVFDGRYGGLIWVWRRSGAQSNAARLVLRGVGAGDHVPHEPPFADNIVYNTLTSRHVESTYLPHKSTQLFLSFWLQGDAHYPLAASKQCI